MSTWHSLLRWLLFDRRDERYDSSEESVIYCAVGNGFIQITEADGSVKKKAGQPAAQMKSASAKKKAAQPAVPQV